MYARLIFSPFLVLSSLVLALIDGFSVSTSPPRRSLVARCMTITTKTTFSRRDLMSKATASMLVLSSSLPPQFLTPAPVYAAESSLSSSSNSNPFDAVRFELKDPAGGVAYLQKCIDDRNFQAVLEFTKEYDQVLRKAAMVKAKKLLPKDLSEKGTALCNAVTFDLIGINRNSRKGQENAAEAQRYLTELIKDAGGLLEMEKYAEL